MNLNNNLNENITEINNVDDINNISDFGIENINDNNDSDYNISFGLPDILFTLTVGGSKNNIVSLIGKMVVVRELCVVNLKHASRIYNSIITERTEKNTPQLVIVSIHKNYGTPKEITVVDPVTVIYIEISEDDFKNNFNDPDFNFMNFNKDTLYILRDGSYIDVKNLLSNIKGYNANLGRGGSQKAHVLSPLDLRLSVYLMVLFNFNFKYLHYINTFNDLTKDRYLPYIDNNFKSPFDNIKKTSPSNSRGYHTSAIKRNLDNKGNSSDISVFSYLDQIDDIIKNSSSFYEAQKEIETSWISLMKKKLEDPTISTWKMLPELIKKAINTLEKHEKMGVTKKRFKLIHSEINNKKHEIALLTIAILITNYNKTGATNLSVILGGNIAFLLFRENLNLDKNTSIPLKFEEWKKRHNLDTNAKLLKLGDYYVNIFTNEPTQIFEFGLDEEDIMDTTSERIINISPEYIETVKNTLLVHPTSLPMLCEPVEWNDKSYGGFIENRFNQNPINTGSSYQGHTIENKESLYRAVNTLNKIKFNINKELLEYLDNDGSYLLDNENENEKKVFQNSITLKIAKLYSKYEFYLNVNSDWRSRLYTNSFFLSYQGGDLSRSLIEFAEGEKLTEDGVKYLYIFGANCYSSVLGKKSIKQRVSWVKKNITKIISLDKTFINKANKKLQFVSFCLAVKNYESNNNYKIKLPVFLDATCSGLQHLAAMLHDLNLATHVNLLTKTENDNVNDLYQSMVLPINNEINKFGKNNSLHSGLSNVELTRDILKQSIMTQVYSVTVKGIFNQLTKKFKSIKNKVLNTPKNKEDTKYLESTIFMVPGRKNKEIELSVTDVYKMAEIIKNASFNLYPSLKEIYTYFIDSAKLTSAINLPLVWFTPAGLEISQFYYTSKVNKVTLSYFGKTRTSVLRDWKPILNKNKQNQSIIPNIIHSLDASHLINVINCGNNKGINPIISIHDCFGTHANSMGKLVDIVRSEFILLYTEHNFLEKYNEKLINDIKLNSFEIIEKKEKKYVLHYKKMKRKDETEYYAKKLTLIPSVPEKGSLDLKEIIEATYIIN